METPQELTPGNGEDMHCAAVCMAAGRVSAQSGPHGGGDSPCNASSQCLVGHSAPAAWAPTHATITQHWFGPADCGARHTALGCVSSITPFLFSPKLARTQRHECGHHRGRNPTDMQKVVNYRIMGPRCAGDEAIQAKPRATKTPLQKEVLEASYQRESIDADRTCDRVVIRHATE
jgi:hypothetical protein